jgi:hypothetical protein
MNKWKIINDKYKNANFRHELQLVINRYNMEIEFNTPDFILVDYLIFCIFHYNKIIELRDKIQG